MDSLPVVVQENDKIEAHSQVFQWSSSFGNEICPSPSCQFMPDCSSNTFYPLTDNSYNLIVESCDCFNLWQSQPNQSGSSTGSSSNVLVEEFFNKPKRGRPSSLYKQINETEGEYRCIFCFFACKSLNEFLRHIDIHAGPKQPFVCQLCGKGSFIF